MANIFTKEQHHGDPLNDHVFYFIVHVNRTPSNLELIDVGTLLATFGIRSRIANDGFML